jgi:predicted transcriptional regulator
MMKQVLVELDEDLLARLNRVAPGKTRKRSEFIRAAIRKALWESEEQKTAAAYAEQPDSARAAYFEPTVWEAPASVKPTKRRRR